MSRDLLYRCYGDLLTSVVVTSAHWALLAENSSDSEDHFLARVATWTTFG